VVESQLVVDLVLVHLALATALFGVLLILVLLSNLKEMPRRWVEWARRAADETAPPVSSALDRFPDAPRPSPGSPFETPRES
jgi:hypothetical protein